MSKDAELIKKDMQLLSKRLDDILGNAIVCHEDKPLSAIVGDKLRAQKLTLATAESCTGGNIAHQITSISGSSEYYYGSIVSYSNEIKRDVLKVDETILFEHGAVSAPVVRQKAIGVCEFLSTDCAVATSGIAGPGGGTELKPVGTVWMAAKVKEKIVTICKHFAGSRDRVIDRATTEAQIILLKLLTE